MIEQPKSRIIRKGTTEWQEWRDYYALARKNMDVKLMDILGFYSVPFARPPHIRTAQFINERRGK